MADFSDNWYLFLVSWKGIYTILKAGALGNAKSQQWFGGMEKARKSDGLLQYLYEARNDEEHGLNTTVGFCPDMRQIGETFEEYAPGRIELRQPPHPSVYLEVREVLPPGPELKAVEARGNRTYAPPFLHLGNFAPMAPISVAILAADYAEKLIQEAATKVN